jgi:HEAT repeats
MSSQVQSVIQLSGSPPAVFAPNQMVNGGHARSGAASTLSVTSSPVQIASRTSEQSSAKIEFINRVRGTVPLTLEVKRHGQRIVALQNVPFGISASQQGEVTLNSEQQRTPWRFNVRVNFPRKEMSLRFVLNYSGLGVADAFEGVRFNKELSQGGEFVVSGRQPITGAYLPLARGDLPSGTFEGEDERFASMLEELQIIESKTRVRFVIPDHNISYEERISIAAVAQIVRTGHATYHAQPWITLSNKGQAEELLKSFSTGKPLLTTIQFSNQEVTIFDTRFSLGPVIFFSDKTRILEEDLNALRRNIENASEHDQVEVRFTPDTDHPIDARYFDWISSAERLALEDLLRTRRDIAYSNESSVRQEFVTLSELAKDEIFEDGVESNFVRGLSGLLKAGGAQGFASLLALIEGEDQNEEVTAETLLWLGRLNDPSTHQERLNLLERSLEHRSPRVRDAAATALASMDDPKSAFALQQAIERELNPDLREDMRQVLAELESVH